MRYVSRTGLILLLGLLWVGCGGGLRGAIAENVADGDVDKARTNYEKLRARDGGDLSALKQVAMGVLEREILQASKKERPLYFAQLLSAGANAKPLLRSLLGAEEELIVAAARDRLGSLGEERQYIRNRDYFDSPNDQLLIFGVRASSPRLHATRILRWLEHPNPDVQNAAILKASQIKEAGEKLLVLARSGRNRLTRLYAIRSLRPLHRPQLSRLLSQRNDPDVAIRVATAHALARISESAATLVARDYFAKQPQPAGIELARSLLAKTATRNAIGVAGAQFSSLASNYLSAALFSESTLLQQQGLVALQSFPATDRFAQDLLAVAEKTDSSHTLYLVGLGLEKSKAHATEADSIFARAMANNGHFGILAAGRLYLRAEDRIAMTKLQTAIRSKVLTHRLDAGRILGRHAAHADEVRHLLWDPEARVRAVVAGAILAAEND